jgi:hypothetical protein
MSTGLEFNLSINNINDKTFDTLPDDIKQILKNIFTKEDITIESLLNEKFFKDSRYDQGVIYETVI